MKLREEIVIKGKNSEGDKLYILFIILKVVRNGLFYTARLPNCMISTDLNKLFVLVVTDRKDYQPFLCDDEMH